MKIAFIGDIALFGNVSLAKRPDLFEYFKEVASLLKCEDLVIGNLESPFSIKHKTYGAKSAYLYSDPENVEVLKWLNVSAVSLANNHMFDYGEEGYETTKSLLEKNNIGFFGAEGRVFKVNKSNNKLAFSGYCCYSSGPRKCVPIGGYGVNEYNLGKVRGIIRNYSEQGFFNIVSVHAGKEHVNYPSSDTIKAARLISKEIPILYIGHHPHVAQGIEKHNNSVLAYSLGNFCFDDVYSSVSEKPLIELSENNRESFILEVTIEENRVVHYSIIPFYIGKDKMVLGKGVTNERIQELSKAFMELPQCDYDSMRERLLRSYLDERKKSRDIMWYIRRMQPRYVRMIMASKNNRKKYNNTVKYFIDNEGISF